MNPFYKDYAEYLDTIFPGIKMQKISLNAGNTCPNRDGTLGKGGCIYCCNDSFTPAYCMAGDSIDVQISKGKDFFQRKYPEMEYLAYFQSFTNTYAGASQLEADIAAATSDPDIKGIIISTRPDCIADSHLTVLSAVAKKMPVFVEVGVETSHDSTLKLINRHHTFSDAENAVRRIKQAGLHCGVHLIMGLPGESEKMMLQTVERIVALPVDSFKFHHLQMIKGTPLHVMHSSGKIEVEFFSPENYLELCEKIIAMVPRSIAIERFLASSPPDMVVAPKWGLKNYQFTNLLLARLKKHSTGCRRLNPDDK